ncbi:unnamed protein product [Musa textilis]
MPQSPSSRWCPTPEQLMILEEMYRSGVRTPSAQQIQQITAHLSNYGRIEGKNVFYWFQNHKARERQKLRRRLSRHYQLLCSGHSLPHHQLYCMQDATAFPQSRHHATPTHSLHLESNGGLNLLEKMEIGNAEEAPETNYEAFGHDWTSMMMLPNRRSLRTLDLFPTTSTGLKDECATSKSSSSTSIN